MVIYSSAIDPIIESSIHSQHLFYCRQKICPTIDFHLHPHQSRAEEQYCGNRARPSNPLGTKVAASFVMAAEILGIDPGLSEMLTPWWFVEYLTFCTTDLWPPDEGFDM